MQPSPEESQTETADSGARVRLRTLTILSESESWIVGRPDSGEFVELPVQAITFLRELQASESVWSAERKVQEVHGDQLDSDSFLTSLVGLGYVDSVDGVELPDNAQPPSLAWIKPRHVRFLSSWIAYSCIAAVILTGLGCAISRASLLPQYSSFFVTRWNGLNIAWNTALFLLTAAGHEFSHLAAARGAGVHARFSLGSRLNMLAAQTTVSGLWGANRAVRFRVYLAGIVFDLMIMALASIVLTVLPVGPFVAGTLQAMTLALFVSVATQFALYMRTDIYFVCQELLRCKNLYGDAWRFVGYLRRRCLGADPQSDPTLSLPVRERRPVRIYAVVMFTGSAVSLAIFALYGAPIMVTLFAQAFERVWQGFWSAQPVLALDGLAVLLVEGTLQVLFLRVFYRKHREAIARGGRWLTRRCRSAR